MEISATLTEIEVLGLQSKLNLADGHAYQDLSPSQKEIIRQTPSIWHRSAQTGAKEAEFSFLQSFVQLSHSKTLANYRHYSLSPTASNSIDIVAAWLAAEKHKVALIEPTFDNLYLLLKRRGVAVQPVSEDIFHNENPVAAFPEAFRDVQAIVLVNPNNPTGRYLSQEQFTTLVNYCAQAKKILVLDNTFRFFVPQTYDQYATLLESGVTFCCIEDTGKIWPTLDLKVSLIAYSPDISSHLRTIYEELYLCISSFALNLLAQFLEDAHKQGLAKAVFAEVQSRRQLLRESINDSCFQIAPNSQPSAISVEWLQINSTLYSTDLAVMHRLKAQGLIVLPGRNFFWSSPDQQKHQKFIRCSLLKPKAEFLQSLEVLRKV